MLNPDPLNEYLVQKPTGQETPEELQEMLESGAFSVDVENQTVYYYQQTGKQTNPTYGNAYSDYYNQAWNKARALKAEGYTAQPYAGMNTRMRITGRIPWRILS